MTGQPEAAHKPVLLTEAVNALVINPNGIYIDGTYGRGGHSGAILKRLGSEGKLYAFDKDLDAIKSGAHMQDQRFVLTHASFSKIQEILKQASINLVDGLLLDLGVSSPQLDTASRGFGFMEEGPLDMRMDKSQTLTAADWLNSADEAAIATVLKTYGEERFARRIASAIVNSRKVKQFKTTHDLADLVKQVVPRVEKHKHPATRTFQAVRMQVNQELDELKSFLAQVMSLLKVGGRLVIISFHSLEDRLVKRFIKSEAQAAPDLLPDLPIPNAKFEPRLKFVAKLVRPSQQEIQMNPRSRSAVMRVAERVR